VNVDPVSFTGASCVSHVSFYTQYLVTMMVPPGLILLLTVGYLVPQWLLTRRNWSELKLEDSSTEPLTQASRVLNRYWKMVIFTLLLLYPRVSSACLRLYACVNVEEVEYLAADFHLVCYDSTWQSYGISNAVFIALYPIGIPFVFLWILRKSRRKFVYLHPSVRYRLGLLYDPFTENYWFWEVLDLVHKLMLTGLVRFFPQTAQLPVGMAVAIAYFVCIALSMPYLHRSNMQLHLLAQVELFLLMLCGSVYLSGLVPDGVSDVIMSLCLLLGALGFTALFVWRVYERFKNTSIVQAVCLKLAVLTRRALPSSGTGSSDFSGGSQLRAAV